MNGPSQASKEAGAKWLLPVFLVVLLGFLTSGLFFWKQQQNASGNLGAVIDVTPGDSNPPGEIVTNTIAAAVKRDLQAIYKVKAGDTLWRIAKKFGVSVAAIQAANKDRDTMMVVGEKLVIPAARP